MTVNWEDARPLQIVPKPAPQGSHELTEETMRMVRDMRTVDPFDQRLPLIESMVHRIHFAQCEEQA